MTKTEKQQRTQTLRAAGSQFGIIRQHFGISQNELMQTGCIDMGYTMLSRTERGMRTPSGMNLVGLTEAYLFLDDTKFMQLVTQEAFHELRKGVCIACDEAAANLVAIDAQYDTDSSDVIKRLQALSAQFKTSAYST